MTIFRERVFRKVIKLKREVILWTNDMKTDAKLSGEQREQRGKWGSRQWYRGHEIICLKDSHSWKCPYETLCKHRVFFFLLMK